MKNFKEVIELWDSPSELASDIGENPDTVRKWKERGSIPSGRWQDLATAAAKRKFPVDLQILAAIARKPKHRFVKPQIISRSQ